MKKTTKISLIGLTFFSLSLAAVLVARLVFAAGTATLSLTPATSTFSQGDTVSVNIYEDSGSDTINAVQADFSYPSGLLSFVGITDSPAFSVVAQNSVSAGNAKVARGSTSSVSGNQLVATVRFTATASGTATLTFAGTSAVVRSNDNGAETLTFSGASYTINGQSSLYITPASKTYNKGDTVTASVYENSGSTPVNAVQANLGYPSSLTFVSIDAAGSAFSVAAQGTGSNGSVKIGRGNTTPLTGAQLIAKVNFTAAAGGTANIAFTSGTALVRSSDNGSESLTNTGATYTITVPTTPGTGTGGSTGTTPHTTTTTPKPGGSSTSSTTPNTITQTETEPPVTTNVDNKPPQISQINVTNLSLKTATITWETSEPASSEVEFGLNTKYVLNVVDPKLTKHHSVSLNSHDLIAHTNYHYRIKSVDEAGNLAFSKDLTFKTEPTGSRHKYGNFWAAFAVIVIIGAGAYIGATYIRRMKSQSAMSISQEPSNISGSDRQSGGTIIKPESPPDDPSATSKPAPPADQAPPPGSNASK